MWTEPSLAEEIEEAVRKRLQDAYLFGRESPPSSPQRWEIIRDKNKKNFEKLKDSSLSPKELYNLFYEINHMEAE